MGKYKDFLIGVEELVVTALEKGAKDVESIYAYVYMYEPNADRDTVMAILDELYADPQEAFQLSLLGLDR